MIATAVQAARSGALARALDGLPTAAYATDAQGVIIHYNSACLDFAGRTPEAGLDRWCVSWRLETLDGAPLAHEDCPMAVALREKRSVRGQEAVAERPDGTRVRFAPYPTPLIDADGELVGAVNLLVDVTDRRRREHLQAQAAKCRRLAASVDHRDTAAALTQMADEYDSQIAALSR
jgi:PAS domain-containing protein